MLRRSRAIFQHSQMRSSSSDDFLPQRRRKPASEQALFHGLGVPQRAPVSTYHTVTLALIALSGTPRYGNRIKKIQTVERRRLDVAEAAPRVFFMGCSKCITELFYILQPPLYFRATSLILLPFRSELACLSAVGAVFWRCRSVAVEFNLIPGEEGWSQLAQHFSLIWTGKDQGCWLGVLTTLILSNSEVLRNGYISNNGLKTKFTM